MAVLRDDAECIERRRRAQDGADIVRIGHLIEHQHRAGVVAPGGEQLVEEDILERIDLQHQPLVRCIARHHPAEIGDIGIDDRQHRRQFQLRQRLTRAPQLARGAFGIGERGRHGMPPPETGAGVVALGLVSAASGHQSSLGQAKGSVGTGRCGIGGRGSALSALAAFSRKLAMMIEFCRMSSARSRS